MATWEAGTSDSYSRGKVAFDMYVVQDDQANNRSLIRVSIGIFDNNGSYGGYGTGSWSIGLNGGQVNSGSQYYDFSGGGPGWIWSGDYWVGHNPDGSRWVDGWASFSGSSPVGSATASGGMWLYDFPRPPYAPGAPTLSRAANTVTVSVTSQAAASSVTVSAYQMRYSQNQTSWTIAGLDGNRFGTFDGLLGATYYVQTRAYSSEGWGDWSTSTAVAIPNVPEASQVTSAVRAGRDVAIATSAVDGRGSTVQAYRAQYSSNNGATWSDPVTLTDLQYVFTKMTPALTYIFRVYAVNEMGSGTPGQSVPIFVPAGGKIRVSNQWVVTANARVRIANQWIDVQSVKVRQSGQWVDAT